MVEFRYGFNKKLPAGTKLAKAQSYDVNASYKDLSEVCTDIRRTLAEPAISRLKLVAAGKLPIEFRRFNKRLGHRRELGGKKGRFPRLAAKYVLLTLENAVANASAQGIQTPYIIHAAANKQRTLPRMSPKGRRNRNDYETARIEIILMEQLFERAPEGKLNAGARELKVKTQAQKLAETQAKIQKQAEQVKMTV